MFIAGSVFATLFLLNYAIDPFGTRDWLVEKRYKPVVHERNEKYNTLFYQQNIDRFDCLILGSSRVMQIVPSQNQAINSCYNFGIHAANNAERLFVLQSWLKHKPLKRLFLGLEFYNFDAAHRPLHLNPHSFTDGAAGNYLSFSTLKMSVKSLKYAISDQPQSFFEPDGSLNYFQKNSEIRAGNYDFSQAHFLRMAKSVIQSNFIDIPFQYEKAALAPLKTIKQLCDKHHIELYVFLTPMQYDTYAQLMQHAQLAGAYRQLLEDLVSLFATVYDFSGDFPPNRQRENFYDPWHFRPALGTLLLQQMLGTQTDYGTKITRQ